MISFLVIYFLCIVTHETGHYILAKITKSNPRLLGFKECLNRFSIVMKATPPTVFIYDLILVVGIISGFIPLIIFHNYIDYENLILLSVFMLFGSSSDILNIIKNRKRKIL